MDEMLSNMTWEQAFEWELFNRNNPPPLDKLMTQIAKISHLFASFFIPKKDGTNWSVSDFYPYPDLDKKKKSGIKEQLMGLINTKGNEKARTWLENTESNEKKHKGTDGKFYKYAGEEFIKPRTTPPRNFKG